MYIIYETGFLGGGVLFSHAMSFEAFWRLRTAAWSLELRETLQHLGVFEDSISVALIFHVVSRLVTYLPTLLYGTLLYLA